jgi:hypothetical protein
MPDRDRAAIAEGLFLNESGWEALDPPNQGGTHLAAGTYTMFAFPPTNTMNANGASKDPFLGTALASNTTSKAQGVQNYAIATCAGFWVFSAAAGSGANTFGITLNSADAAGHVLTTSTIVSATALSTLAAGWNNVAMVVPADRTFTNPSGVNQGNKVLMLFPGDTLQLVIGTGAPPATTVFLLDIS